MRTTKLNIRELKILLIFIFVFDRFHDGFYRRRVEDPHHLATKRDFTDGSKIHEERRREFLTQAINPHGNVVKNGGGFSDL